MPSIIYMDPSRLAEKREDLTLRWYAVETTWGLMALFKLHTQAAFYAKKYDGKITEYRGYFRAVE